MAQRSSPGPQHTNTAASENADPITHQVGGSQGCEVMIGHQVKFGFQISDESF